MERCGDGEKIITANGGLIPGIDLPASKGHPGRKYQRIRAIAPAPSLAIFTISYAPDIGCPTLRRMTTLPSDRDLIKRASMPPPGVGRGANGMTERCWRRRAAGEPPGARIGGTVAGDGAGNACPPPTIPPPLLPPGAAGRHDRKIIHNTY